MAHGIIHAVLFKSGISCLSRHKCVSIVSSVLFAIQHDKKYTDVLWYDSYPRPDAYKCRRLNQLEHRFAVVEWPPRFLYSSGYRNNKRWRHPSLNVNLDWGFLPPFPTLICLHHFICIAFPELVIKEDLERIHSGIWTRKLPLTSCRRLTKIDHRAYRCLVGDSNP